MTMRRSVLAVTVTALVALLASSCSSTKTANQEIQEGRKELVEMTSAELNRKATKAARDEAKKLKKEGWMVAPGALPLDKQLDRSYMMQYEFDENLYPKYIMGEAMSVGSNYDGAKMQALELAKQNLAGQIQTEITALVENTVSNEQLEAEQAETITRSVLASKNLISQNIGRTLTVVEVYRTLPNKNKEVLVRIAYSSDMAMAAAKKAVRENLEEKGEDLHNELEVIFSQKQSAK